MTALILQQHQNRYSLSKKLFSVANILHLWMARSHQRKQLAQLKAHELKDIGLDWESARAEIEKPFWK